MYDATIVKPPGIRKKALVVLLPVSALLEIPSANGNIVPPLVLTIMISLCRDKCSSCTDAVANMVGNRGLKS